MTDDAKSETIHIAEAREKLLSAALFHVPFDGWSATSFKAAAADSGLDQTLVKAAAPRGAIDLAVAFHRAGDRDLKEEAEKLDLESLRYSEKVARLVRARIELAAREREAVRRGVTLFSLPIYAAEGARLIWETADAIWTILGDTSEDYNWYTKRAILSGVYSSTVLFWLGDDSEGSEATWRFLDRRIEDVMRFEKVKSAVKSNRLAQFALIGPKAALSLVRAPGARRGRLPVGLPGGGRFPFGRRERST
ncbi:MAG: COQ9 family protein [Pseudomonadota bacterium]